MWHKYLFARSVEETVELLAKFQGKARIIAGGTDLVLQLKRGELSAEILIDITGIEELRYIRLEDDTLKIGALCTHADVASSDIVKKYAPVLAEACASVGSPQIRNEGTIAGNVASTQPAGDGTVALLALDAKVKIVSREGLRVQTLNSLFEGRESPAINPTQELITGFEFQIHSNQSSSFQRLAKRKALALPIVNVAASIRLSPDKQKFEDACIAMGPVAPNPKRSLKAESALRGKDVCLQTVQAAAEAAYAEANPRDSLLRGSSEYRKQMASVLTKRAINAALERLGVTVQADNLKGAQN